MPYRAMRAFQYGLRWISGGSGRGSRRDGGRSKYARLISFSASRRVRGPWNAAYRTPRLRDVKTPVRGLRRYRYRRADLAVRTLRDRTHRQQYLRRVAGRPLEAGNGRPCGAVFRGEAIHTLDAVAWPPSWVAQ